MTPIGSTSSRYSQALGLNILHALLSSGQRIFSTLEFQQVALQHDVSRSHANLQLSELARAGWIQRIRRGLYAVSHRDLVNPPIHPFAIATHLVSPSAISHWSALHHHGLTEQLPHRVQAMTPKPVVTPAMRLARDATSTSADRRLWKTGGLSFQYFTVIPSRFIGVEQVWMNEADRVPMTTRERTVFQLFLSPQQFGGIGEGLSVVSHHLHTLIVGRLIEYALTIGMPAAIKRLGWALETSGVSKSQLRLLREIRTTRIYRLDPSTDGRGPIDTRWSLQINT